MVSGDAVGGEDVVGQDGVAVHVLGPVGRDFGPFLGGDGLELVPLGVLEGFRLRLDGSRHCLDGGLGPAVDVDLKLAHALESFAGLERPALGLGEDGAQIELGRFEFALKEFDFGDHRLDAGLNLLAGFGCNIASQRPGEALGREQIVIELAVGPYESLDGAVESLDCGSVVLELDFETVAGDRVGRVVCGPRGKAEGSLNFGHNMGSPPQGSGKLYPES